MKTFFILGVLLFYGPRGMADQNTPLIFLHGIKGSTLVDENQSIKWLTPSEVLGFVSPPLNLPLEWDADGIQSKDKLVPLSILDYLRIIPGIYSYPIYGSWLKAAAQMTSAFYPFAYDWRRDNLETLHRFEEFIQNILQSTGQKKVNIVGHSMGGLLAFAYAGRNPEKIAKLFLVGSPLAGGIGFLPDLTVGTANGLNKKILAPEILSTFPSVYTLFPLTGVGLVDGQNRPQKTDFFAYETWIKNFWGFFRDHHTPTEKERQFMNKALERAREFRFLLKKQSITYPPIFIVSSRATPTLKTYALDSSQKSTEGGDGRVCASDALPPEGIAYKLIETRLSHEHLLEDPQVQKAIKTLVRAP